MWTSDDYLFHWTHCGQYIITLTGHSCVWTGITPVAVNPCIYLHTHVVGCNIWTHMVGGTAPAWTQHTAATTPTAFCPSLPQPWFFLLCSCILASVYALLPITSPLAEAPDPQPLPSCCDIHAMPSHPSLAMCPHSGQPSHPSHIPVAVGPSYSQQPHPS